MTLEVLKALAVILEFCLNQDSVRIVLWLSSARKCLASGNYSLRLLQIGDSRDGVVFRTNLGHQNLFIKMQETTFSRKLDSSGRIMIPVRLREQMGLVSGQEYYFTTMVKDGRKYICIDCGSVDNTSLEEAMRIIQANGMKIVESTD